MKKSIRPLVEQRWLVLFYLGRKYEKLAKRGRKMKRRIVCLTVSCLMALSLVLASCAPTTSTTPTTPTPIPTPTPPEEKEEATVLISGEIGQEPYVSPTPVGSDIAYHGDLTIKNIGQEPLVFDIVEITVSPIKGKSLRMITSSTKGQGFRIPPGDTDMFDFTTDGYTSSLLADAKGSPLILTVVLRLNGQTVAGPFMATLPELWDLPNYYEKFTKGKKLAPIKFL